MYIWKYWPRSGMDWHYEPSRIRAKTRKCHRWVRESCAGTLGWRLRGFPVVRIVCWSSISSTPITVWSGSPSLRRTWNSSGCRCCFYFWVPSSSTTCALALNIIFGKKKMLYSDLSSAKPHKWWSILGHSYIWRNHFISSPIVPTDPMTVEWGWSSTGPTPWSSWKRWATATPSPASGRILAEGQAAERQAAERLWFQKALDCWIGGGFFLVRNYDCSKGTTRITQLHPLGGDGERGVTYEPTPNRFTIIVVPGIYWISCPSYKICTSHYTTICKSFVLQHLQSNQIKIQITSFIIHVFFCFTNPHSWICHDIYGLQWLPSGNLA